MISTNKRTRFERRVDLERSFLGVVNRHFQDGFSPLSGMTGKAISSWKNSNADKVDPTLLSFVVASLREASKRAELLADNSKETFQPSRDDQASSTQHLLVSLEAELAG